ncbi:MAG: hypothetical protein P4L31_01275 [Candidatus Babeliales bacterium]|nr:hypothetical protein [Candidatus Babeliales bacterium]
MLKKILILLLSANLLVASSDQETGCHIPELSPNEKKMARVSMVFDALAFAAFAGKRTVYSLPEGASVALKTLVFASTALGSLALEAAVLEERDMMDFYKRHKWFLYFSGGAMALSGVLFAAAGLAIGLEKTSLLPKLPNKIDFHGGDFHYHQFVNDLESSYRAS